MDSNRCFVPHRVRRGLFALSLCLACSVTAFADDNDNPELAELPIVLTASRMRQPLAEAPAAVTVIDREMIEHSGVRQIADLLRLVPGAAVGYNDGNWPVATLRGMSGAYASGLQVLIDGVSVYSPVFGGMLWAELPISIEDIERIEVVRGPNGASYGANAFQGVVNIITHDPVADDRARFSANIGNDGIRDETIRFARGLGDWRYRATLGQRYDDGFEDRLDSEQLTYGNLNTYYQVSLADSLDVALRFADKRKETREFSVFPANHLTGDQLDLRVRWNHAESTDDEWWIQYYHQKFSQRDRLPISDFRLALRPAIAALIPFPVPLELEQDYATWRDGVELQSNRRWSNSLRTVTGAEVRRDAALSARLFGTNEEQAEFLTRIFGTAEWTFAPHWIFNAGALFERNSFASSGWSPRVALIYELAPGQSLRAGFAGGRRTPSLYEEKANYGLSLPLPPPFQFVPLITDSGRVDSERVKSKEFAYVFSFPRANFNGDARWFSESYTDLISFRGQHLGSLPFTGGDAVNLDRADVDGIDLTLNWRPFTETYLRFATALTETTSTDIGTAYSPSVPRSTISLLLSQSFADNWNASANYQRVSKMFWTDAGQNKQSIPAIDHLNLRLAKSINRGDHAIELAGVLQNALGHYRDYYLGSSQGTPDNVAHRIFFLQLKADY